MIHPDTELRFISKEKGYGVVATKLIPKGTITWALDKLDRSFTPTQVAQMEPRYQEIMDTYCYRNNQGNYILCWDIARYVNHSFQSNCLTTAYEFEVAIRDIQPGEELTDDYGYLNIERPFRGADEGTRRKVVYPDDLLRYHKVWDKQVQRALGNLKKVDQPLIDLLSEETWNKVSAIAEGKREMDSLLTCYFEPEKAKKPKASVNGTTY
jgi:hypothetical protein